MLTVEGVINERLKNERECGVDIEVERIEEDFDVYKQMLVEHYCSRLDDCPYYGHSIIQLDNVISSIALSLLSKNIDRMDAGIFRLHDTDAIQKCLHEYKHEILETDKETLKTLYKL